MATRLGRCFFFYLRYSKMDTLKRLVREVDRMVGQKDIQMRREVNQLIGGSKSTPRWITRRDKRVYVNDKGKKVRNWREKMEYDRLRDEYARLPPHCGGKVGISKNPPFKKADIVKKNRRIRDLIEKCQRTLEHIRAFRVLLKAGKVQEAIQYAIRHHLNVPLSMLSV